MTTRLITTAAATLSLLAFACNGGEKKAAADETKKPTEKPAVAASKDAKSVTPAGVTDPPDKLKQHMQEHFDAIVVVERALVQGSLEVAKEKAAEFARHKPIENVEAWKPHLDELRATASQLANAADISTAAQLTAKLGTECANCHSTTTAISSFKYEELPEAKEGDTAAQMRRHQWATDRLWEGLVGPSRSLWAEGAEVLAAAPFYPPAKADADTIKQIKALADKVQKLGGQAVAAATAEQRAQIYGELLTTCSSCHSIARPTK